MAAIFDLPLTPKSESIQISLTMLLDLKNGGTFRQFGDNAFESRKPIYSPFTGVQFLPPSAVKVLQKSIGQLFNGKRVSAIRCNDAN